MTLNNAAMTLAANTLSTNLAYGQLHSAAAGSGGTSNVTSAARQPISWAAATGAGSFSLASQINFTGGAANGAVYSMTFWTALPLTPPVMGTPTTAATGGTLTATTYFYRLTAFNALGEGIAGAEVSQTTTGSTSTVTIPWTAVAGATGYKLYRSTSTGTEIFLTSISGGSTITYTDTGSITPSGSGPPSTDGTGGTFYGEVVLTGDTTFNSAGQYNVTSITVTGSAT